MSKHQYYFDYAATTPLDPRVFSAMLPYFNNEFGNPSNLYTLGRNASRAVKKASEIIADILRCRSDEFFYTSSATEADNLAILGTARSQRASFGTGAFQRRPLASAPRIIISQIEHKGILAVCDALKKPARHDGESGGEGFEIVKLPVLKNGLVDLNELKKELDEKTILVSITSADSETGTIQPIAEISKLIKKFRNELRIKNYELSKKNSYSKFHDSYFINHNSLPYLHTDASQSAGYLDINVNKLGVDMMTLSAHKFYGPKGIGGLYVRRGVKISPIIYGGGQQGQLRSGTENVPGIVGFAEALRLNEKNKTASSAVRRRGGRTEIERIKKLRDTLEKGIFKTIPKVILNGHLKERLPNFLNISILDVEGEAMLLHLDELGIMAGTGSACNSQNLEPSYILAALGHSYEYIHGSLRFTLGHGNTMADIKYVLKHLPIVVKKLRKISPLELKIT